MGSIITALGTSLNSAMSLADVVLSVLMIGLIASVVVPLWVCLWPALTAVFGVACSPRWPHGCLPLKTPESSQRCSNQRSIVLDLHSTRPQLPLKSPSVWQAKVGFETSVSGTAPIEQQTLGV